MKTLQKKYVGEKSRTFLEYQEIFVFSEVEGRVR